MTVMLVIIVSNLCGCVINEIGTNKSPYRIMNYDDLKPVEDSSNEDSTGD